MRHARVSAALCAAFVLLTSAAQATDYYVSPSGNDSAAGTSPSAAWRTFAPVNSRAFMPGDRILLEGGQTFTGGLTFDASDRGTAARPITVTTYGAGRATLRSGAANGLSAVNTAGFSISNLVFVGPGASTSTQSGVSFYADLAGDARLAYVHIDHVDASGYRNGIAIGSWSGATGFTDVQVSRCDLHANQRNGMISYGQARGAHRDVVVSHCRFWDNLGDPSIAQPTGNGIDLGEVDGGLIERSVAWNNGVNSRPGQGPVGIWAYNSNRVTIQYCESYANRTSGTTDGGGFDLDINMTSSVMQYNYSHDNDGAGFGLYQGTGTVPWRGNVVRYNVSQNDGRRNGYGAITVWTNGAELSNCDLYHNTVFVGPSTTGMPRAVRFNSVSQNIRFFNNLFVTTGGVRMLDVVSGQTGLVFQGNNYWTSGGAFSAVWNGATYNSLAAWIMASGQERRGTTVVALNADPLLTAPGMGGTIGDADNLATLAAYRLRAGSPMVNAGLDLRALFMIDPGAQDYYGTALPQGRALDVGAHEFPNGTAIDAGAADVGVVVNDTGAALADSARVEDQGATTVDVAVPDVAVPDVVASDASSDDVDTADAATTEDAATIDAREDAGCGCRVRARTTGGAWPWALALVGVALRRRAKGAVGRALNCTRARGCDTLDGIYDALHGPPRGRPLRR